MKIPTSHAGLRMLGKLKRETARPGYNPGEEGRVFEYEGGLTVWTIDPKVNPGQVLIEYVEITSPRWKFSRWANVGDTLDSAQKRLGKPITVKDSKFEIGGDTDSVTLHVSNNRIVRIVYNCYVG